MSSLAAPAKTEAARKLLAGARSAISVPMRMLLINVDGQRGVTELLDIARALNLGINALECLRREGLITDDAVPAITPPTPAAAAPAPVVPSVNGSDALRRLMRAKMFAFDLACRMLAGRDGDLRARARDVNSESRFLEWMTEASALIEAASDVERAQLFRDRVAQAAI